MEKIQLKHPEGKKAVSMDKDKYDTLKNSFVKCLKASKNASFKELLADVTADLQRENIKIKGVIEWNLFWVTLDMEARNELKRDNPYRRINTPYLHNRNKLMIIKIDLHHLRSGNRSRRKQTETRNILS